MDSTKKRNGLHLKNWNLKYWNTGPLKIGLAQALLLTGMHLKRGTTYYGQTSPSGCLQPKSPAGHVPEQLPRNPVHFNPFGIPDELPMEGGLEFMAGETQSILRRWGLSAHFPHSHCRAEVGVKTRQRLVRVVGGQLDNDRMVRALLQYSITPTGTRVVSGPDDLRPCHQRFYTHHPLHVQA